MEKWGENEGPAASVLAAAAQGHPKRKKEKRKRKKHFSPFSFFQLIPHASSSAPVILASTHAALSGYSEIEIHLSA